MNFESSQEGLGAARSGHFDSGAAGQGPEAGVVDLAEAWFQLNCPPDRWNTIKIMFDQYREGTLHGENRDNFLRLCAICLSLEG